MSARCASCHYPLSVCDSVACHECSSHFHLDCAQLVGFPLFELSAEPSKNSFHCTTCRLLPLPNPRGNSDSSDDEAMPSRQYDYALEASSESGKDMNEVKGSIQDLSDLCKDMLREINDLKSINLTLRCCIENLKHDNEQRDIAISELKQRLDLFTEIVIIKTESLQLGEKLAVITQNEGELTKAQLNELSVQNVGYDKKRMVSDTYEEQQKQHLFSNYVTSAEEETEGYELKDKSKELWDKQAEFEDKGVDSENKLKEEEILNSENKSEHGHEKETVQVEEVVKAEIISDTKEQRQDWLWKGSRAVEVDDQADESEEEDEDSEEESDSKETPSWKKLQEEIESAMKGEEDIVEINEEITDKESELEGEESDETEKVRKSVTWDENIEEDSDSETYFSQKDSELKYEEHSEAETETFADDEVTDEGSSVAGAEERLEASERELHLDTEESITEREHRLEADEILSEDQFALESSEVLVERESGLGVEASIEGELHLEGELTVDGEPRLEGDTSLASEPKVEGEITEDLEARLEGETTLSSEPRVEVEVTEDGEARLEGGVTEEGDIRLEEEVTVDGEPRPGEAEFADGEEVQPPQTPPPNLTEEDLWLYLKENVSSVHPSTVEEFVQNLIGTLQHVPQEYLKPVIDANIKRANSPSLTDGEHLPTTESIRPEEGGVFEDTERNEETCSTLDSPAFGDVPTQVPGVSSALEATD